VRVIYSFMIRPDVIFLADLYAKNEKENLTCGKKPAPKIASESSASLASKPRRRTEASLGERLVDSTKELRAHLRGEMQLSETVYHVPPETDVRA
jgi:hypothetical protein